MTRKFLAVLFITLMAVPAAFSQQQAWVQVEAHPSLNAAQTSIRRYAAEIQDVAGFSIGGGWYAVALGPYAPGDAQQVLRVYRAEGIIPRDAYIADGATYRQQFWPVGANSLTQPSLQLPDPEPETEPETQTTAIQPEPEPEPEPADETPRQARRSEAELSREDRAALQTALQWAGFYNGAIDAAFGRGTRGSMARWQEANNFEPTGVLTTLQRAVLLKQYNSVLEGMGLRTVSDTGAGIEMLLPMGVVGFDKYEAPFAHYTATGDINAQVLLISQAGDANTLTGLYDIMQTLEIVPEDGPRTLKKDAFTLIGESALMISHSQAWLKDGEIKGFTLIWPAGDEERRTRVLGEMQESFTRIAGVMDPAAGANLEQRIDLVSGLEIRKPKLSRSGFFVDGQGSVVTTTQVIDSCGKITIDRDYAAQVVARDDALGIAVLRPVDALAPISVARFQSNTPRLKSAVAVSGFSYGGVLGAPTVTFGELADLRGLNGETELKRLALNALDGDAGGPVVDAGGAVLGMLLPAPDAGRQLPEGVSFAADAGAVRAVLDQAGIGASESVDSAALGAEILTRRAADMTALVSCWD